ncbi:putative Phy rapidly regulated 1 [Hibiscus syriacus]|uniref:Phy rapidly regulated 1 n=1 Tax=Hibiscus syriacus TaxID=106335 RepID=A0A6A2Y3S7_HIBSY|nr:peroxisomal and mitochondrial division factor 1-like [Hibiscus syriacus]KAE8678470.1 putative Phy rapidly regulated 1 [Hibiscus syriacus]
MEDSIITDENDNEAKLIHLTQKVEALEKEKLGLGDQNKQVKEKIKTLTLQVNQLRNKEDEAEPELDEWEDDHAVLESLASRSADLENEVSRLQHDLIISMRDIDEANKEAVDLKRGLEEKEAVIESLEKEMDELKKEKMEIERKERDLERKFGILQVREIGERSRNVRTEEEMKEKTDGLQKKVEALEAEAARTRLELEKTNAETLGFEETALMLEFNISELKKMVERKKVSEGINERSTVKGFKACLFRITAGSAAVLFAAAVAYLFRRKR